MYNMMNKCIIILILLQLSVFGSNKSFDNDVKKYLEKDFYKYGIVYDQKTSTITFFETEMLFKNGSANLRRPFEMILDKFFPDYIELLLKHKKNIQSVIVKGHTSSLNRKANTYEKKFYLNKILSQQRADNFFEYASNIQNDSIQKNLPWIKKNFIKKGLSSSNLIYDKNGKENLAASRRIEIQILFNKKIEEIEKKPESDTLDKLAQSNPIQRTQYTIYKESKRLDTYVQQLLNENPSLEEKYELLKSFQSAITIAKASFRPTVSLNFSHSHYITSEPDDYNSLQSEDVTIRYNLFNGFKDQQELNIQKYNYSVNKYLNEQVEIDLIYSLVESFINIQKQKDVVLLAKKNLDEYDLWLEKEDIKFESGITSLRNYAKIQSRDINQRVNYKELKKQYQDTIHSFKRYLNFDEEDIENFEDLYLSSQYLTHKSTAYEDIDQYSPYIKQANQIVILYKEKLNKSKVNFYPTVDLLAKKSRLDENYEAKNSLTTNETTIALEASLALYSGGKERSNNDKSFFEYRSKIFKKESVRNDVKYKLDLAFNKYELTFKKYDLLKELVKRREDALFGASYDYKFAKIDANELLDSVDDLYIAKKLYIENKYDKLLSQYKILNVIGILKETILKKSTKDEYE